MFHFGKLIVFLFQDLPFKVWWLISVLLSSLVLYSLFIQLVLVYIQLALVYSLNKYYAVLCLVTQSCPTLCDPMDFSPPGSSVHGDSPGMNPGVGCHALLQGIFPTQGSNPGLPHCRWIRYCLGTREAQQILLCTNYVIR